MTTLAAFVNRPKAMLDHLIESHKNELALGAEESIRRAVNPSNLGGADKVAQKFFDYLASPYGSRCLKPGVKADDSKSPLERIVAKLPVQASSVAKVAGELQIHIGHLPPGQMAAAALGYLGFGIRPMSSTLTPRYFRDDLVPEFQPPIPRGEARLRAVLDERFHDVLPEDARDAMARTLGSDMLRISDQDMVPQIAKSLTIPGIVANYPGGKAIASDDPRLTENNWANRVQSQEGKSSETRTVNQLAY